MKKNTISAFNAHKKILKGLNLLCNIFFVQFSIYAIEKNIQEPCRRVLFFHPLWDFFL